MRIALRRAPGNRAKVGQVHQLRLWSGGPRYVSLCGHDASAWMKVASARSELITCDICLSLMGVAPGGPQPVIRHADGLPPCDCCGKPFCHWHRRHHADCPCPKP